MEVMAMCHKRRRDFPKESGQPALLEANRIFGEVQKLPAQSRAPASDLPALSDARGQNLSRELEEWRFLAGSNCLRTFARYGRRSINK
jgi:hypothetical protein